MSSRQRRAPGGTPIEEAPWWVLGILTFVLWLVAFPALVGLLHGLRLWHGERLWPALAAAGLAVVVVIGLATRQPWKRPSRDSLADERPLFARFSTWLWSAVLYPNVLMGAILLMREGPPPDFRATLLLGVLLATVQTGMGWLGRGRKHKAQP
jgi:hypothetical protein